MRCDGMYDRTLSLRVDALPWAPSIRGHRCREGRSDAGVLPMLPDVPSFLPPLSHHCRPSKPVKQAQLDKAQAESRQTQ